MEEILRYVYLHIMTLIFSNTRMWSCFSQDVNTLGCAKSISLTGINWCLVFSNLYFDVKSTHALSKIYIMYLKNSQNQKIWVSQQHLLIFKVTRAARNIKFCRNGVQCFRTAVFYLIKFLGKCKILGLWIDFFEKDKKVLLKPTFSTFWKTYLIKSSYSNMPQK